MKLIVIIDSTLRYWTLTSVSQRITINGSAVADEISPGYYHEGTEKPLRNVLILHGEGFRFGTIHLDEQPSVRRVVVSSNYFDDIDNFLRPSVHPNSGKKRVYFSRG